ncbi:MAG: endonuclease/exonuclease/phosphatase family protein [Verrucomicrobia bacterium]|nr:endonuclease/exonuclease/phosphatase family protein [Verrucomicrobiota bacterium]
MKSFTLFFGLSLVLLPAISAAEKNTPQLRVLTYNIHHGEGTDRKFDLERLARVIMSTEPDVVALQEVDRNTARASGVNQASMLGKLTGLSSVFGKAMHFDGGEYGEALLSRFPIDQVKTHPLPYRFGQEPRAALQARITPTNGLPSFLFVGTHLCHQSEETRTDQTRQIDRLFLSEKDNLPIVLAGDFNARTGSAPMNVLLENRWLDASSPKSRIDYVLVQRNAPWKIVDVTVLNEPIASDHDPVLVVLEWRGSAHVE